MKLEEVFSKNKYTKPYPDTLMNYYLLVIDDDLFIPDAHDAFQNLKKKAFYFEHMSSENI
jgi:hypothetical protein